MDQEQLKAQSLEQLEHPLEMGCLGSLPCYMFVYFLLSEKRSWNNLEKTSEIIKLNN